MLRLPPIQLCGLTQPQPLYYVCIALLQSQRDRRTQEAAQAAQAGVRRAHRRAVQANVARGGKPFYLKRGDEKRLQLLGKFRELRDKGKVEAALRAKRKRNQARDQRNMPGRRSEA